MDKSCHLLGAFSNSSVWNESSWPSTGMSSCLEFELCCAQKTNRMTTTTTTMARRELQYDGFSELAGCS